MKDWDVIALRGLTAAGSHGVFEFERNGSQDFVADILLYVDARRAADSDDVADTVDYSAVADGAVAILTGPSVYLIETLASRLAELALTFTGVAKAQVTVHKPMAPLTQKFADVCVTVVRERRGTAGVGRHRAPVTGACGSHREQLPSQRSGGVDQAPRETRVSTGDRPHRASTPPPSQRSAGPGVQRVKPTTSPVASPEHPARARVAAKGDDLGADTPASGRHGSAARPPRFLADPSRPQAYVYDVVLALGANRGEVVKTLRDAVEALAEVDGLQIDAVSPLVETLPVLEPGALPQDNYFNAVVLGRTVLAPPALLLATQEIENRFGRVRARRWGARTLDIDIIDVDRMRLDNRLLTLPHPRAHARAFVLYPWRQVDPQGYLPGSGAISTLLAKAEDRGGILREYPQWLNESGNNPGGGRDLHLAPRAPHRTSVTVSADAPRVTLRGTEVSLAAVDEDSIFQRLLAKEERDAKRVPRARAQSAPLTSVAPPRRPAVSRRKGPESRVEPSAISETPPPMPPTPHESTRSTSIPVNPETNAAATPPVERVQPALPEWNFRGRSTPVRVIDYAEDDAATGPETDGTARPELRSGVGEIPVLTPRLARGVTVRPTPTGSMPVTRPATRSKLPWR